jgi:hypothetical protein
MSFNLFGPASSNDIKVGYIDPERGFVDDATICEANDYAKKNPGTTFILKTRKSVRYLNINEVNRLTPDDTADKKVCKGVEFDADCGPLEVLFYGGGGVGAKANPVVGEDGSLLAIDLVSGGFGYQYPPITEAKDECGIGAGALVRAVLGEVVETVEVFDQESDFENYELCDTSDVGYGVRYGANGEELGVWEPTTYASLSEDPIKQEILEYQEFLQRLSKPWWTTRKFAPLRTTTLGKVTRSKFDVTFPQWGDFMNQYAISPVPPSNTRGSDFAGIPFSFEWEEDFPYDGDYIFKGLCDNKAELYIDGSKVFDLGHFNQAPRPVSKRIRKGVHTIKIDLFNAPIFEEIPGQEGPDFVPVTFNVYGQGKRTNFLDFHFTAEDGSHSFVIRGVNKNNEKRTDIIRLKPNIDYKVKGVSRRGAVEQGLLANGKKNKEGGANSSAKGIFADYIESANDNDDLQVKARSGEFSSGKKSTAKGGSRSTFSLSYRYDVEASRPELASKVVSAKAWNENPMGVSLSIDAPLPPIPQEPIPPQEGRCPNNPIWTTRFSNSSQKWWPVIFDDRWSNFMNRYAISPIPPSSEKGSDGGGVAYRNSWTVDIPYDGFYGVQGTRDNFGRLLIDGIQVSGLNGFSRNDPDTTKVFLTRGTHQIDVEIENQRTELFNVIDRKIFDTLDWGVPVAAEASQVNSKLKPSFVQKGRGVFLDVGGAGTGEILFSMDVNDNPAFAGIAAREIIIPTDTGSIRLKRDPTREYDNDKGRGSFTAGKSYGPIQIIGAGAGARGPIINKPSRLGLRDADSDDENIKVIISDVKNDVGSSASSGDSSGLLSGSSKDGVTYSGEELFKYSHPQWSDFMNKRSVSPKSKIVSGTVKMIWNNVNFPEDGQYEFFLQGDNIATVLLDGAEVARSTNFKGDPISKFVTIGRGRKNIEIELQNVEISSQTFDQNPCGVALRITKKVNISTGTSNPWTANPIGISAILIPPPCPKRVRGRGVVTDIIVDDPGNGYAPPFADLPPEVVTTYPTALRLKNIVVEDPGINYSCGSDQIQITPSNGAILDYECDTFGRIVNVKVLNPGLGFTTYPEITIPSNTGVNATFRPQFEVVRDPIVVDPTKLIQVTDLVGLKQTGYVEGRPYYGSVFYKDGVRYAGFYETIGDLVQVYDTLQESIDAQVTTPPSAIQRQGTDISSNDPRLNLPGTPENLI